MATSRSGKKRERWTAGAYIFSGRPDPTWSVPIDVAKRLIQVWRSAQSCRATPRAPALGYRGAFLRDAAGGEWVAYAGVVILRSAAGEECREDGSRTFEKLLLASAPPATLPAQLRIGE